jgi:quercetin dioxygenase-like cupin family protein
MTESAGVVISAADAPTLVMPRGGAMAFLASAADTGGAFALREFTIPPGTPPVQPHRHACALEAFYVRSGAVTFLVGEREAIATPGTLVVVPRGAVHAFGNFGGEEAILVMIDVPPNIAPEVWRRYGGEVGSRHGSGESEPADVEYLPEVRWAGRP